MAQFEAAITIHGFYSDVRKIKKTLSRPDPAKVALAETLDKAGVDAAEIQAMTGWVKSPAGRWMAATTDAVMRQEDWITFSPFGQETLQKISRPVSQMILSDEDLADGDPSDQAFIYLKLVHEVVKPEYERWKHGQTRPETGTPLGIWPGITPAQADALKTAGIRTVEEFAKAGEKQLFLVRIAGIDQLQRDAVAFLKAQDQQRAADELVARDERLEEMERTQKELIEHLMRLQSQLEEKDAIPADPTSILTDQPPKRGRPRKTPVETAETEVAA